MTEPVIAKSGVAQRIADAVAGGYADGAAEATEVAAFEGHADRRCREHRTVGPHRAWCFDDSEWCYPDLPCRGCLPEDPQDIYDRGRTDERENIAELIDAAGKSGWRNAMSEIAVWCDQKAGNRVGSAPETLRAVAAHARERAR